MTRPAACPSPRPAAQTTVCLGRRQLGKACLDGRPRRRDCLAALGWATTKTAAVSNPHLALIFPLLCFFSPSTYLPRAYSCFLSAASHVVTPPGSFVFPQSGPASALKSTSSHRAETETYLTQHGGSATPLLHPALTIPSFREIRSNLPRNPKTNNASIPLPFSHAIPLPLAL